MKRSLLCIAILILGFASVALAQTDIETQQAARDAARIASAQSDLAKLKVVNEKIAAFEKEHARVLLTGTITEATPFAGELLLASLRGTTKACLTGNTGCGLTNVPMLVLSKTAKPGDQYSRTVWFLRLFYDKDSGKALPIFGENSGKGDLYAERTRLEQTAAPTNSIKTTTLRCTVLVISPPQIFRHGGNTQQILLVVEPYPTRDPNTCRNQDCTVEILAKPEYGALLGEEPSSDGGGDRTPFSFPYDLTVSQCGSEMQHPPDNPKGEMVPILCLSDVRAAE
jgi:hypothetical protein